MPIVRRLSISAALCVVVAMMVTPPVAASPSSVVGWRTVPSPNPGELDSLFGVSALSSTNAWAVGIAASGLAGSTLILHWDGATWIQVASPNPALSNTLEGVLALSPDDVWAVGIASSPNGDRTLIEHWDGLTWKVVRSPNPDVFSELYGVMGDGTGGQLWAVGTSSPTLGGPETPLIEEWDGSTWTVVPTPGAGSEAYLYGGSALADDDAWAVGQRFRSNGINGTLIEHWDGTAWSVVPSPNPGRNTICLLTAVAAVSASDAWVVGYAGVGPLLEHWDGSSWALVSSPKADYAPNAVTVGSGGSVWTVGSSRVHGVPQTATERWDGSSWRVVPSPSLGHWEVFAGIAAVPGTHDLWAVGNSHTGGVTTNLIELFS